MSIKKRGCLDYNTLIAGGDHWCLWLDITFKTAFSHNVHAVAKSQTRWLHCKEPRVVSSYVYYYEKLAITHKLQVALEKAYSCPMSPSLGWQVAFSPALQSASKKVHFLPVTEKTSAQCFSSRSLKRAIKKPPSVYSLHNSEIKNTLNERYTEYYNVKKHHQEFRAIYLENLVDALAE
jgi:hypothetical protein